MTSLVVGLLMNFGHAVTQTRLHQDLWDCSTNLSDAAVDLKRLARRFSRYVVTDVGTFSGTRFDHENETADAISFVVPDASLPKNYVQITNLPGGYHLYDVGFKNLERDAKAVNRFAASRLLGAGERSVVLHNTLGRAVTLVNLHALRWAFHDEVLDTFRQHRSKSRYFRRRDYEQMVAAIQHDNSDVLGITGKFIDLAGNLGDARDKLLMSLQISYDQPKDFLFPSLDGMLEATGQNRLSPRTLPFLFRLTPDRRDEFTEWFWSAYGHLRTCELARLIKKDDVPEEVEARLFLEALRRVIARQCQFVVATQDSAVFRLFEKYEFKIVRPLPTGTAKSEHLVFLDVSSIEFWASYRRLSARTGLVSF